MPAVILAAAVRIIYSLVTQVNNCSFFSSISSLLLSLGDYPIDNGAIRLIRSGLTSLDYTSGIVQVFQNGQWTNICRRNTFSLTEAHVLCHQLGYSNALNWSFSAIERYMSCLKMRESIVFSRK